MYTIQKCNYCGRPFTDFTEKWDHEALCVAHQGTKVSYEPERNKIRFEDLSKSKGDRKNEKL